MSWRKTYIINFLLYLVYTIAIHNSSLANNNIKLQRLFTEKELPGSIVSTIYQDHFGYMWFGIESAGIYRYDGINLVNYQHNHRDSSSLSNNFVNIITEDQENNLWVGTTGGLDVKLKDDNKFLHLFKSYPFIDLKVNAIIKDDNHHMYVGTNSGLYVFENYLSKPQELFLSPQDNPNSSQLISDIAIRNLFEDSEGIMWIGTSKGLFMKQTNSNQLFFCGANNKEDRIINITSISSLSSNELIIGSYQGVFVYDKITDYLKRIVFPKNTLYNKGKAGIKKILVDNKKRWWIASMQYGLICANAQKKDNSYNIIEVIDTDNITSKTVIDLYKDKQDNIWISSKYEGLFLYDKNLQIFEGVTLSKPQNLNNEMFVMAMVEDQSGKLYAGTRSHGVYIYNDIKGVPRPLNIISQLSYYPRRIESLFIDSKNHLWIGTNKGFFIHSLITNKTSYFKGKTVMSFFENDDGNIWLGMSNGILIYNSSTHKVSKFKSKKNYDLFRSNTSVGIIQKTKNNALCFGTLFDGLFVYYPGNDSLVHFANNRENNHVISDNSIRSLYEDQNENLWIGTRSQGVIRYNSSTDSIAFIYKEDGLVSNAIYNILPGNNNQLWMGTDMGLIQFDTQEYTSTNYNQNYGLPTTVFEPRSSLKLNDGKLAFGYYNGIIVFNPDSIKSKRSNHQLIISAISVDGQIIKTDVTKNESINLKPEKKFITIDFALLDYALASKNQYRYILEGLESDWHLPTTRSYVSYTNLSPGTYTFKLKAANYQNEWTDETIEITFILASPFWKTSYAYMVYLFTFGLLFFLFYWVVKTQVNLKHEVLQKKEDLSIKNKEYIPTTDTLRGDTSSVRNDDLVSNEKQVILIADDNYDLIEFLAENLENKYTILKAINGQEAFRIATNQMPDIIISDIMMPEIDGIELCKRIKSDLTTCHIPFIMLTAKRDFDDKIEGMQAGADEYIEKPFNINYLQLKLSRLLELRHNIQKQSVIQGKQFETRSLKLSSQDKKFINTISDLIINNLSNSDYNVEKLSEDIGLNRAQLNRKLKALINQSPMELIYTIRLDEAKKLLTTKKLSVSEVALKTGFKSPSSFSTVFKNKYGYPPSNISSNK